jgi:hypothetical protein
MVEYEDRIDLPPKKTEPLFLGALRNKLIQPSPEGGVSLLFVYFVLGIDNVVA